MDFEIRGLGGDDLLVGGAGDDEISGGTGDDTVVGNGGDDTLSGSSGNDTIEATREMTRSTPAPEDDYVSGGTGDDTINGSTGSDTIDGGDHDDEIRGGSGDDFIDGGKEMTPCTAKVARTIYAAEVEMTSSTEVPTTTISSAMPGTIPCARRFRHGRHMGDDEQGRQAGNDLLQAVLITTSSMPAGAMTPSLAMQARTFSEESGP
ncbi:MAG: calcium-binding protein [Planctomycetota bacterium]